MTTPHPLLTNVAWHALTGPQRGYSAGGDEARRYARGYSPIIAFADPAHPNFDALLPHCGVDEVFYCDGWAGAAPPGWHIEAESVLRKLVWDGSPPLVADNDTDGCVKLSPEHADQALALAMLTRPGPFGPRTLELGDYYGCFDGPRLVAMAGERMQADYLREISGVCTHPDHQGRGHARRLMERLIVRQLARGETPFLHVMHDNEGARRLYARMGFADVRSSVVRVLRRESA